MKTIDEYLKLSVETIDQIHNMEQIVGGNGDRGTHDECSLGEICSQGLPCVLGDQCGCTPQDALCFQGAVCNPVFSDNCFVVG